MLEALTPIAPELNGEKLTGLLINLDCSDGLTLRVRTDRNTIELHSSNPDNIQFLSYTANVGDSIKCGARNPGAPVNVTYRPISSGAGQLLGHRVPGKKSKPSKAPTSMTAPSTTTACLHVGQSSQNAVVVEGAVIDDRAFKKLLFFEELYDQRFAGAAGYGAIGDVNRGARISGAAFDAVANICGVTEELDFIGV